MQDAYHVGLRELGSGSGMQQTQPKHSARGQSLASPSAAVSMTPRQVKPQDNIDSKEHLSQCQREATRALDGAKDYDRKLVTEYSDRIDPMIYYDIPEDIDSAISTDLDNSTEANPKPSSARLAKRGDEEYRVQLGRDYYGWLSGDFAGSLRTNLEQCRDDKWHVMQKYWHAFHEGKEKHKKLEKLVRSLKAEASSARKASTSVSTFTTTSVKTTTVAASAVLCTTAQSANGAAAAPSASSGDPPSSTSAPASTTSLVVQLFDAASVSNKSGAASSPNQTPASSSVEALVAVTAAQGSTKADEPAAATVTAKAASSPSTSSVPAGFTMMTVPV